MCNNEHTKRFSGDWDEHTVSVYVLILSIQVYDAVSLRFYLFLFPAWRVWCYKQTETQSIDSQEGYI
jgi:hypothetical protein